jgi:hypothetical protein
VLNEIVQQEPATSLNAAQMGSVAAIGLVKGNPFPPDARMKKILAEAAAVGNAASRTLFMSPRDPSWSYYPGLSRWNLLFQTGYEFETLISRLRLRVSSPTRPPATADMVLLRRHRYHLRHGHAPDRHRPAICLANTMDADKNYFDGAKTYKATLPKDIPGTNSWSFTVYDNQRRSMLDTANAIRARAARPSRPRPAI